MAITDLTNTTWKYSGSYANKLTASLSTSCNGSISFSGTVFSFSNFSFSYTTPYTYNSDLYFRGPDSSTYVRGLHKNGTSTLEQCLLYYYTSSGHETISEAKIHFTSGSGLTNSTFINFVTNAFTQIIVATNNVSHCTLSPESINPGFDYTGTLTVASGYSLPNTVMVNGKAYAVTNGQFTIPASDITGDFTVSNTSGVVQNIQMHPMINGVQEQGINLYPKTVVSNVNGLSDLLANKQDTIVAGNNITINADGKTINASSYTQWYKHTFGSGTTASPNGSIIVYSTYPNAYTDYSQILAIAGTETVQPYSMYVTADGLNSCKSPAYLQWYRPTKDETYIAIIRYNVSSSGEVTMSSTLLGTDSAISDDVVVAI